MNNPRLRGAGEEHPLDDDMLQEYFRCAEDVIYFAEKYFYINNPDEGRHKIKLFDYQKKSLKVFTSHRVEGRKNAIILMSRQMGKCFFRDSKIKIRNHKTGEIKELSAQEFFESVNV